MKLRPLSRFSSWPLAVGAIAMVALSGCGDSATGTTDAMTDVTSDTSNVDTSTDTSTPETVGEETVGAADTNVETDTALVDGHPPGWTTQSHSNDVDPNIAEVFSDTEVKRIDITFSAEEWATMMADMTEIYGAPSSGGGGGGGPGGGTFPDQDPVFVPADIRYKGVNWTNVGVRFKGNSSLQSTWKSGNLKLSFKLDFDEFEDTYPEIKNQRFYGIKKLSLKNNFDDSSLVREKVMADVFADFGMTVSHTAFYAVYVDRGNGAEYFGVYTMAEEVDDTVIKTQFINNDGNLYKPDGTAAQLSAGSFDEAELVKKNNEAEADFSDVQALLTALHAPTRTSDPAAWRAGLEAVFDTDVFLQYLAINTIGQNWDTYGRMTHNYFLYNNPETSKLTWIPWDNNEALQAGKQGGSLPLTFSGLNANTWPLIGFLYADATYKAVYEGYLQEAIDGPLSVASMHARYNAYEPLLAEYAAAERSGFTFLRNPAAFAQAFTTLRSHAQSRVTATQAYLGQ